MLVRVCVVFFQLQYLVGWSHVDMIGCCRRVICHLSADCCSVLVLWLNTHAHTMYSILLLLLFLITFAPACLINNTTVHIVRRLLSVSLHSPLSCDACLGDEGKLSEPFCAILHTTVVDSHKHTHISSSHKQFSHVY